MKTFLLLLAMLLCAAVQAQTFPDRPIRLIVPFPPGGNLDFVARAIQPGLSKALGQPVIIDNKGGAAGIIGTEYAAKQPADGYTILIGNTGPLGIYPSIYPKLPYDPAKDFAGVGMTSTSALLAALNPAVPANTLQEFLALARNKSTAISAAVAGSGSIMHFATEMLKEQAGIDMLVVTYPGSGPAVTDLLGGHVQFLIDAAPVSMPYIKIGKLKAIAVTGRRRLDALPETPTFEEAGLSGLDAEGWQGITVPAGTPSAVIEVLSRALKGVLAQPQIQEVFGTQGLRVASMSSAEFSTHIGSEVAKWKRLATSANIKVE